jgi:hypothetical protein
MVTNHHEISHILFEDDPDLIARALRRTGLDVPDLTEFEQLGTDLTTVQPVERRADRVVRYRAADGHEGIFVIEVQRKKDLHKPAAWGFYGMTLVNRYRLPVVIVVVASDPLCERWARQGFDFGLGLGDALHVRPLVLGPSTVARITDPAAARADPYYATLSVLIHHDERDIGAILEAAAEGLVTAPEDDKSKLANYIEATLAHSPAVDLWRDLMALNPDIFQGATFRSMIEESKAAGIEEGKAVGIAEGKAEGIEEGKAEGIEEGKAVGIAEGKVVALLRCLDARGIAIDGARRELVTTCTDKQTLDQWLTRAFTADTATDVFGS